MELVKILIRSCRFYTHTVRDYVLYCKRIRILDMETKDDDDDATLPFNPSSENSLAADDDSIQYDNEMKDNIGNQA
jgi:hypothetical protein